MRDRVRLAALHPSRNQGELNLAEEIVKAFTTGVARVVPSAAVPKAGCARGNLRIPLIPRRADMVFARHAHFDSVDKKLIEAPHRLSVEH